MVKVDRKVRGAGHDRVVRSLPALGALLLLASCASRHVVKGEAALEAGFIRLRPVVMTALAMMIGMLPMAMGFGEGGEQNAPLGRAVIGGLLMATFATLFLVPVVYSVLRKKAPLANLEHPEFD